MNRKKTILIFGFLVLFVLRAGSQISFSGNDIGSEFNRAMDLFNKEKYAPAIKLFDSYIEKGDDKNLIQVAEAEYYAAVSALMLFNPDAEYRILMYISTHPDSPRKNESRLALADYFYQNKSYRKAADYYTIVDRQEIPVEKLPAYFFRYGYSLYIKGDKEKALVMFSEIKDIDTEYTPPAIYYYSQIAYEEKMYQTALEGFMKLKDDVTFGPVVPFYIAQIMYLNKDFDALLEIAPELLKSAPRERAVELYRFIGDAYYKKGRYKEALPYLEQYSAAAKTSGREDKYQLGYCYYMTGATDKAIKTLLEIGAKSDQISQNIWYTLGDCYLKKGDKKRAQFAFGQASQMEYDLTIREEALFNYAKLTYETSYSPFGEAIAAFQEYINMYPGSDKLEEAYNYLVSTLMEVRNYSAAMAALDKIRNRDSRLETVYQKVAFFRGLELFKNLELASSIDMFDRSLKYEKYNRELKARAYYWRGEAKYRMGRYNDAKADYEQFIAIPGSSRLSEYRLVRYNIGYCCYNLKDYTGALTHFKTFESEYSGDKPEALADVKMRIADCYFINTNYAQAISAYDKVIDSGRNGVDYAMYQKAFALGLMNNNKGKAEMLTSLIAKYPDSPLIPNAVFERGRAYVVLDDFVRGESDFNTVISLHQGSQFAPRAIVQLGLLYYDKGDYQRSVAQFKRVIENYKSTPEARSAMTGLKNAYVDMNDVESYFSYVKTLGYGDVNMNEKDSLLYASGEKYYIEGKCDRASEVFRNYLNEFINGSFRLNAQYYLADCLNSMGRTDEALTFYNAVIMVPNNQFMEQSLIAASSILFTKEDYQGAGEYYKKLEQITTGDNMIIALRGRLRSAYQDGDAQMAIDVAEKIAKLSNVPEELTRESIFVGAKAHYSLNEFDEALVGFRKTATEVSSIEGAESKYRVAELLYKKGSTDESEKVVTQFIDQNTPHQYWMAKVFLLLADISMKKDDRLQARATLQSLKEYYTVTNDGILDEVNSRLASLDDVKEETAVKQ